MIMVDGMVSFCGHIKDGIHRLAVRVYYAETDFSGIVYHSRYLEFLERGRTEFLRLADIHHHELAGGKYGELLAWVVRRLEIDFITPAHIDDVLIIETGIESVSGARINMQQRIIHDGKLLGKARVKVALVNREGRPRRFPREWAERFQP